ncbi:unnamed protein product [Brachionus calyciflorus]|uniref:Lariat debranching enzyme C-terminal domain-containing protein n=1 Tax=Brachionus calyciflorus TaxID=104777 RepID=A0A813SAG6_9BILA|nr:unnamed protein product [Brachionus calyciflorus]
MKIAIEGCCHGELDKIYSTIEFIEKENNYKIDLLIICGDFQSVRNVKDLESMAVPEKYRSMCSFWKYYAGISKAPILTLFIGGNHEASTYLKELPYGGWVAPNIYYMGYANVINFNGIRIAGLSGIFKSNDFFKGHYEFPPFNRGSLHSIYHVRNLETFRLSQIKNPIDIMITHDWPSGIYHHGNIDELLRFKPYFASEIESNTLGSPENEKLLKLLKPKYWFSAHLHVKFSCIFKHEKISESVESKTTKFLSLDKCLPRRKFLQVIDIGNETDPEKKCLSLDPEWLCILKKTDHLLSVESYNKAPIDKSENLTITDKDLDEIKEDFQDCFEIPPNFKQTAPPHRENSNEQVESKDIYLNEQTTLICEMLNIRDPIRVILEKKGKTSIITESTTQLYNDLLDEDD